MYILCTMAVMFVSYPWYESGFSRETEPIGYTEIHRKRHIMRD